MSVRVRYHRQYYVGHSRSMRSNIATCVPERGGWRIVNWGGQSRPRACARGQGVQSARHRKSEPHCTETTAACATWKSRYNRAIQSAMARLHEYQGKAILAANGFKIPRGRAASTADEAAAAAREFGGEVVIKIQAWTTGRAGIGGVAFAKKADIARGHAARMLEMKVGQVPVEAVLVEEKIDFDREFFLSFAIDDATRAPTIIFAPGGGTGIEDRAASTRRIACDVIRGPDDSTVAEATASCGLSATHAAQLADSIGNLFTAARKVEARSLEINPL